MPVNQPSDLLWNNLAQSGRMEMANVFGDLVADEEGGVRVGLRELMGKVDQWVKNDSWKRGRSKT